MDITVPSIWRLSDENGVRGGMRHLTIGLFHDEALGRELGKKDTESDIVMFNRKVDDHILSFMSPVEDKLSAKSQIVSSIDAAVVVFSGMTTELGETVVMLDSLGISRGISVVSPYATPDQITSITKGTSIESFIVEQRDPVKILHVLKGVSPERDTFSPPLVVIDHSFNVRGVGEVVLGFIRKGVVRKFDKLKLLPADKEVMVRSIQIQDEDYDGAEAGSRVGLALKGATVEEMRRGSVLCAGSPETDTTLKLAFTKSPFYSDDVREGASHATVGMQTLPVIIIEKTATSVVIKSEKPIVHAHEDTFLLLDLNARKMRIMGTGHALQN
jgi:selenocysteine-specific translation elongation factor